MRKGRGTKGGNESANPVNQRLQLAVEVANLKEREKRGENIKKIPRPAALIREREKKCHLLRLIRDFNACERLLQGNMYRK